MRLPPLQYQPFSTVTQFAHVYMTRPPHTLHTYICTYSIYTHTNVHKCSPFKYYRNHTRTHARTHTHSKFVYMHSLHTNKERRMQKDTWNWQRVHSQPTTQFRHSRALQTKFQLNSIWTCQVSQSLGGGVTAILGMGCVLAMGHCSFGPECTRVQLTLAQSVPGCSWL